MSIRKVFKENSNMLHQTCSEVTKVNEKVKVIVEDLRDTMYKYDGVGIAAPQIGILERIIVIDITSNRKKRSKKSIVLINPIILKSSDLVINESEGCLSFPYTYGDVERYNKVKVIAINEKGKTVVKVFRGEKAFAIQHEIDHLNGVVFKEKAKNIYIKSG